jgi:hypothetical protein
MNTGQHQANVENLKKQKLERKKQLILQEPTSAAARIAILRIFNEFREHGAFKAPH